MANAGHPIALFQWLKTVPNGDKWGHLVLATILTVSFNGMFGFKTIRFGPLPIYIGTVLVAILALLEESTQFYIPNRTVELLDLTSDGVGLIIGSAITWCIARALKKESTP